jgi:hypothetical protein
MSRTSLAVATALLTLMPAIGAAQTVNMGETFHAIEARARRVTTTFSDAVIDVRRGADRSMSGELRGRDGKPAGRLHVPGNTRRVQWQRHDGSQTQEFGLPEQAEVSLDWVAHQLYALHVDDRDATANGRIVDLAGDAGTWDGHVRRNRRALARGATVRQLAGRLEAVETTFDDVVVKASIDRHEKRARPGKKVDYSTFTATIHDPTTGQRRGFVRWFDTAQVLTWKIDGRGEGVIMPDRLPNGWTFTPTMEWANVQAYQFVTQATASLEAPDPFAQALVQRMTPVTRGVSFATIARVVAPLPSLALAVGSRAGEAAARLLPDSAVAAAWHAPWTFGGTAAFNDAGCDRLHWLDGTIFRQCCDQHDRCFEANGCNEKSWFWPFSGSWSCAKCNIAVTACFCTATNPYSCGLVGSIGGDGGSDGGGCSSVAGGFCPVECQTCSAR